MSARVAVVTGAAGGIGRACVERLAADGFEVVSVDRTTPGPGRHATHLTLDLLETDAAVAAIRAACDRVDALVNCAGVTQRSRFGEVDTADWERIVGINLRAPFFLTQGLVDRMPAGGTIVNIASIEATTVVATSGATSPIYAATKAALRSLTETLAVELGPAGIRVNAVAPGLIRTPLTAHVQADERGSWIRARTPLGRFGEPTEIADAVAFLAGPGSTFVTGTLLVVDGGFALGHFRSSAEERQA